MPGVAATASQRDSVYTKARYEAQDAYDRIGRPLDRRRLVKVRLAESIDCLRTLKVAARR